MKKKVVVGLGNPGKEYEETYHNVGYLALEKIVSELSPAPDNSFTNTNQWENHKKVFEYIDGGDVVFVRPLTFMNESGKAVREALKKFNAKKDALIVIHDDSDLTLGNIKTSFARGAAGHKGVQSIIDALGTNEFQRIRIGIRPPAEKRRQKAGEFALKKITAVHKKILKEVWNDVLRALTA